MSFFGDLWDALTFTGNARNQKILPLVTPNNLKGTMGGSTPPPIRPPALSERDAISNFRQGERDSYNSGLSPSSNQFPSMSEIMDRLNQLSDPSRYMADPSQLLEQARAQAAAQYDPVIAQLRGQMGSAETRANRNKQALGEMFGQLSNSLSADIPGIEQKFAGAEQETQGNYDRLKQSVQDTYAKTQADQEAMMKRLNIEAAAPEVLGKQMTDRDYFTNLANNQAQTAQTALGMEQRGATEYTRRGSEQARTEGTQRQADLMNQLSDVLGAYEQQIGANEAAKAQAIQAGLMQLQSQSQQQARQYAQGDFDNYLKSIQLGRDLRADDLNQLKAMQVSKTASPADVAGRAMTLGLSPVGAQNIQNIFNDALMSSDIIQSGLNPASDTAATKEALASQILQKGRQMGLSPAELNALQTIALEYFGRA